MQFRLEEEEEAKAALMSRIQRLTKLILVSTKNNIPALTDSHQQPSSVSEEDVSCRYLTVIYIFNLHVSVVSDRRIMPLEFMICIAWVWITYLHV